MNRRGFLKISSASKLTDPAKLKVVRRTNTGLNKYTGTWSKSEVSHLLRRTIYGPKLSEINGFAKLSLSEAVTALLDTTDYSFLPPVNNYHNSVPDTNVPYGKTWVNAPVDINLEGHRKNSVKSWFWSLPVRQKPTIMEKMIVFWHNHFAIQMTNTPIAAMCYTYVKVLNDYALGNFKTLTQQVTVDPAMLFFLNGRLNTKRAPDENYARELQELFTLGKGPNSKYTEDDVKAAARVLTGFSVNPTTTPYSTFFVSSNHDTNDKTFSSFYGNKVIKGKTGLTAGTDELKELLDMIFAVDEVSLNICRRLYRYFVYYDIDDNAETNVIEPLAKIFRDNNFEIKPVLRALLESEHFYDSWNRACVIKDPLMHIAGYIRQWEMDFPDETDYQKMYKLYTFGSYYNAITQMDLGDPPSVSGWEAWYQVPLFQRSWITSDSLPKRNEFQDYLMWSSYKVEGFSFGVDSWKITKQFANPSDADKLIEEAIEFLLPLKLESNQISTLKEILLPGGIPSYNWTDEYNAAVTPSYPNHATALVSATVKLKSLYKSIMNLSEYQLA